MNTEQARELLSYLEEHLTRNGFDIIRTEAHIRSERSLELSESTNTVQYLQIFINETINSLITISNDDYQNIINKINKNLTLSNKSEAINSNEIYYSLEGIDIEPAVKTDQVFDLGTLPSYQHLIEDLRGIQAIIFPNQQ